MTRHRPSTDRRGLTHKVAINCLREDGEIEPFKMYITANTYEDGTLCELFLTTDKEGSTVGGLLDAVALLTSIALQSGVGLRTLVEKFAHSKFEPSGSCKGDTPIHFAKSPLDYIYRWLEMTFLHESAETVTHDGVVYQDETFVNETDAPICGECGSVMVRHGSCHTCHTCGSTSGCG